MLKRMVLICFVVIFLFGCDWGQDAQPEKEPVTEETAPAVDPVTIEPEVEPEIEEIADATKDTGTVEIIETEETSEDTEVSDGTTDNTDSVDTSGDAVEEGDPPLDPPDIVPEEEEPEIQEEVKIMIIKCGETYGTIVIGCSNF